MDNAQPAPRKRTVSAFRRYLHFGSPLFGYTLAFALSVIAGWGEFPLLRQARAVAPLRLFYPAFSLFYPVIALTSYLAGAGPGIAAIIFAGLFGANFFPRMPSPLNWMALTLLGPILALISVHIRRLRELNRASARELVRFKFIGDHASDWIFLLGEAGEIQYANRTAAISLGLNEADLVGGRVESLVSEAQRPALRELLQKARSGPVPPLEVTFTRDDGTGALMELICTGVRTEGDHVIHVAARDITERRQIEQKLHEMRHWESLGVMAGGMAHDFNNLLMSVIGNAELAKDLLPAGHAATEMIEGVIAAGERSADLVRLMLATSGHRDRHSEPLDLDHIMNWILSSRSLPENVHVSRKLEAVNFTADRRSMETLLWSVIANAAESYGGQEGTVDVVIGRGKSDNEASAPDFEDGRTPAGDSLTIVVNDSGSGMSREVLERAFDPFFSTRFTGRGLGLPAVRGIVRAYSGRLRMYTAAGAGTRVEIHLPMSN